MQAITSRKKKITRIFKGRDELAVAKRRDDGLGDMDFDVDDSALGLNKTKCLRLMVLVKKESEAAAT